MIDQTGDLLVGVAILVGLAGVLVPVLPGLLLVWAAIAVWSTERQDTTGWVVLAVVTALLVVGQVAKYLLPGRQLGRAGIPARTTLAGAALGLVGFFVVPVVGIVLGFVLGIYLAERHRLGSHERAVPSTLHALRAAGWSLMLEMSTGLMMAATWVVGVLL